MRNIRYCLLLHDAFISMIIFLYLHVECIVKHMFSCFSMYASASLVSIAKACADPEIF